MIVWRMCSGSSGHASFRRASSKSGEDSLAEPWPDRSRFAAFPCASLPKLAESSVAPDWGLAVRPCVLSRLFAVACTRSRGGGIGRRAGFKIPFS